MTAPTASPAKIHPAPDFKAHPVQLLAFGFGSGLSPKAPGTAGTLLAIPLYLLFAHWSLFHYTVVVVVAAVVGVWICGAASRQLEVHDHPGIVWDEFVGYWITMWALPTDWIWVLAGFAVFRVYDIVKPWPVSVLDRRVGGGFGIMVDDILAGVMACFTLHIVMWLV
jgi:phosphatidylglycerophosphatase A